jgi:hypothetical protein
LSGLILHAGQTAGRGRKGKENDRGFNGMPNPTGTTRRGLKSHLRFVEGCRSIRDPISGAVLDDRATVVPLHGKISLTRTTDGAIKKGSKKVMTGRYIGEMEYGVKKERVQRNDSLHSGEIKKSIYLSMNQNNCFIIMISQ